MGVDIAFYIDVQNQDNWVRLHFKPPFETKEDLYQSYWDTDCYFCRYYHFTNFLDEAASHIRGTIEAYYCVRRLRDIVSGIVAACHPYVYESEVRIFYLIC